MGSLLTARRRLATPEVARTCARCLSAAQSAVQNVKIEQQIHGYTVRKVADVPELFLTAVALEHNRTGAQHLHLARDDDNNTFSVAFRTTPMDSTGIPHILEHTVLCGSKKYPVRDPFFKMLNRSLATFMNAFTASDWTMYPFCTQNRQDFENLLSVYLDAVFFPQLREQDFSQEGWRLEHENPQDSSSPVVIKGVVFNEMKGVFSNPHRIFDEALQNKLLPSHTYGVVSGGDPLCIPDLTWSKLKEFHTSHYHPSNARFLTYGSFPLECHLETINKDYLRHFSQISVNTAVPPEARWSSPREDSVHCHPDPMAPDPEKQTMVSMTYLLSNITDRMEAFTLSILGSLLVDGETSPFYQSLLEANIGSDYAPGAGYQGCTLESSFSVGLQGIHRNDVEQVKKIIRETFDRVIKEGFEKTRIAALLHRIELGLKHQAHNFGLSLAMNIIPCWNHDGDPIDQLQINELVELFRQKLQENPQYLQDKMKQYFKENSHCLTLTMSPEEGYERKCREAETRKLEALVSQLGVEDRKLVYDRGVELLNKQMAQENVSCLPTLKIQDISLSVIPELVNVTDFKNTPIYSCAQPTNQVTYLRMISNCAELSEELHQYLPLFCSVLTRMGAGLWDYKQLSQLTELYTGGLDASTHLSLLHDNLNSYEQGVLLSSYCLDRNLSKMLDLWTEVISAFSLADENRLLTLIRMNAADMASSLADAGHSFALTCSASTLNPVARWNELYSGITQVNIMKKLAETTQLEEVCAKLKEIGRLILNKQNLRVGINASPESMCQTVRTVEHFVQGLPGITKAGSRTITDADFQVGSKKIQMELPFNVNYVSQSMRSVPYGHEDYARLQVLSRLLSAKFLHREIREKGGAYGSGAVCGDGVFSFFSYRDPNSLQTLNVFNQAMSWAVDGQFSDQDIEEAKLSVFQLTDKPVPPGSKGMKQFLHGITDEMRQCTRTGVFAASRQDLTSVADKYLSQDNKISGIAFLGPANSAVQKDKSWSILKE